MRFDELDKKLLDEQSLEASRCGAFLGGDEPRAIRYLCEWPG